jgi:hypothetical protein
MYFEVHVVATEFRRKILAKAEPQLSRVFFLTAVAQKR